ncbi:MAG: ribosome assembly RNA-binding protein YhbY [Deltaproteobacteria bacterium]|nr:ribosome assembly RNA-binding protein YhbY [Candidatus Anaeroferrophillus wilburensis]MBN2889698.1 ribosome assembly RNA-binding protein YhbY [Deltaproteobacteria bacterium]
MLEGFQRKYLRGLAHGLKPLVYVGQKGLTDGVVASVDEVLELHELIKVKFVDFKEKSQKEELAAVIVKQTGSELAGIIGNIAIFYRQQQDPAKRTINLPQK